MVGIPAFDRKLHVETVRSLLNEQAAAVCLGDELTTIFAPGCSLITYARNHLAREFMQSDAERLVFVDADIAWEVGSLLKIAHSPVDFAGGAYRYKDEKEGYPVQWLPLPELWSNSDGLIEVASLPGGFLSVSRTVFTTLSEHFTGREYTHGDEKFWAYFHAPFRDGKLYGEDASFCAEWRDAGGSVWINPELSLTHVEGSHLYKGHIGNWLKSREAA
jgi:hypothetical protein